MNDILAEIQARHAAEAPKANIIGKAPPPPPPGTEVKNDEISGFFLQVTSLQEVMQTTSDEIRLLSPIVDKISIAGDATDLKHEFEMLSKQIETKIALIADQIRKMDQANKMIVKEDCNKQGQAETRIKCNMIATLSRKLSAIIEALARKQDKFKKVIREEIVREYKEEDIEAIRAGECDDAQVFADKMLQQHKYVLARNKLHDIQKRHQSIGKLVASVKELHLLVQDCAAMVDAQGELIHSIEYNVSQALEYVNSGNQQLDKAVEYQTQYRKKLCCIFIVVMIILIIIIAPILGVYLKPGAFN